MKGEENICPNCDKPIKSGRPDKKFCSEGCRNEYHNKQKMDVHSEIRSIDLALKKNRRILKKYFHPDKPVDRESLLKEGFDFAYHTHHLITKTKGHEFIFCYDYGYREVDDSWYKIIRRF